MFPIFSFRCSALNTHTHTHIHVEYEIVLVVCSNMSVLLTVYEISVTKVHGH